MLYVSLLQSVQVMLAGRVVGGFCESLARLDNVRGPVTVSTFVRVSVRQKVPPLWNEIQSLLSLLKGDKEPHCLRQAILRKVGYRA